jgi:glucosamine-6-phosphate deaminase
MSHWTKCEKHFLAVSGKKASYEGELIPALQVQNIYALGKAVALRFLEWCLENPNGVVALPTGRTPEFFIKTLEVFKNNWNDKEVQADVQAAGIVCKDFPKTSGLKFVMLDEFFPMLPSHRNSFSLYIRTFYCTLLDIPDENVLSFDLIQNGILTEDEIVLMTNHENIDVGLLERTAQFSSEKEIKPILERVHTYCQAYEARIKEMGGIGFFLGGIGPDGHIAFNQQGQSLTSVTRLVNFNYPSAAAAASDLGGIEIARGKAAMTVGLGTITANPNATIIIMAAGEGKGGVVRAALEEGRDPERPASALHGHAGAKFYITNGAATHLNARKAEVLHTVSANCVNWMLSHLSGTCTTDKPHLVEPTEEYQTMEQLLYETSLAVKIPVHELERKHLDETRLGKAVPEWLKDELTFSLLRACASRRLREKVEGGLDATSCHDESILHTAPHHDDIMLSYHAAMHGMLGRIGSSEGGEQALRNPFASGGGFKRSRAGSRMSLDRMNKGEAVNDNVNHFAYLTSGFHSVNDSFLWKHVETVRGKDGSYQFLTEAVLSGEITRDYDDLMSEFNAAFFTRNSSGEERVESIIFLRKVAEVYNIVVTKSYQQLVLDLKNQIEWLREEYLKKHTPGDGIPKDIQMLKGCMRESEVDRVWALSNMPMNRVHHLRSKFYTDDFFTPMPSVADDAMPMANLIKARQPGIISVAFDPEGTGPDTHYKVLQVVAAGLRIALQRNDLDNPDPLVWGYRNVWFVFTPSDATLFIPAAASDLDLMHDTFMSCFTTQKAASFPSPHYDGPFSAWARHLQQQHKAELVTLLGEKYFTEHRDPRVRNCTGFIFLKAMRGNRFLKEVEELKSKFEVVKD